MILMVAKILQLILRVFGLEYREKLAIVKMPESNEAEEATDRILTPKEGKNKVIPKK